VEKERKGEKKKKITTEEATHTLSGCSCLINLRRNGKEPPEKEGKKRRVSNIVASPISTTNQRSQGEETKKRGSNGEGEGRGDWYWSRFI